MARHNAARKQWLRQTSACFHHRRSHQAIADRIQTEDGLGRGTRGSRRAGLSWRLPEATNESLCEDIMPPSGEDAFESYGKD